MKKLLIILIILFSGNLFAFANNILDFQSQGDDIVVNLKKTPTSYNIAYYNYGVNFFIKGVSSNNLIVKKFDEKRIVRVLPLSNDQMLIKIQYPIKNLRQHVKIIDSNNLFSIVVKKNIPVVKVNKEDLKDDSEEKSVVDVAKDLSLLNLKKEQNIQKSVQPENIKEKNSKNIKKEDFTSLKNDYNFSKNAIKTYSVLFVLCLIIVMLAFFLKKFRGKLNFSNSSSLIKIIYQQQILPKKTIAIVKIFNEYYIIGITDSNFSLIDKVHSDILKEEIKIIEGKKEKDKFINYLKRESKPENIKNKNNELGEKEKLIKLIQNKLKNYNNNV